MAHEDSAALGTPLTGSNNKAFLLPSGVREIDALVTPDRTTGTAYVTNQRIRSFRRIPVKLRRCGFLYRDVITKLPRTLAIKHSR